ncbi:MAG TPA: Ig-like domain-containing protein [Verrucomicrobiae bacterium]|nr:Ig-like domain-containing protein [Verrucomicrobiae bacterium]HTZ56048.1 Ig-like domain-containing protein [Candidatus Acidoferrum sp.]
MSVGSFNGPTLRYAGYDIKTGQIVHTHSRFSVAENRYVEIPIDELKARFSTEPFIVSKLTGQDPKNLDFVAVTDGGGSAGIPLMVDTAQRKLVPRPSLQLTTKKPRFAGDGTDSAQIDIAVVDRHGKTIGSAGGKVKVTATRGKLSAPGGIVDLAKGRATVTLTSVNETVDEVHVAVTSLDAPYTADHLVLAFL